MGFYYSKKNDAIVHWSFGKQSDNHKYVARVVTGKNSDGTHKYRYFYTTKEYQSYLNNLAEANRKKIVDKTEKDYAEYDKSSVKDEQKLKKIQSGSYITNKLKTNAKYLDEAAQKRADIAEKIDASKSTSAKIKRTINRIKKKTLDKTVKSINSTVEKGKKYLLKTPLYKKSLSIANEGTQNADGSFSASKYARQTYTNRLTGKKTYGKSTRLSTYHTSDWDSMKKYLNKGAGWQD